MEKLGITGIGESLIASILFAAGNRIWNVPQQIIRAGIIETANHFREHRDIEPDTKSLTELLLGKR